MQCCDISTNGYFHSVLDWTEYSSARRKRAIGDQNCITPILNISDRMCSDKSISIIAGKVLPVLWFEESGRLQLWERQVGMRGVRSWRRSLCICIFIWYSGNWRETFVFVFGGVYLYLHLVFARREVQEISLHLYLYFYFYLMHQVERRGNRCRRRSRLYLYLLLVF